MNTLKQNKPYDLKTATSFVIANMVGTGVFVSLAYQVAAVPSAFAVLMLWLIGGFGSLCGALSYVALARLLPRSGGEYHYLTQIYGKPFGFMAGFITIVVGFAAPVAGVSIAFAKYAQDFLPPYPTLIAVIAILIIAFIHIYDVKKGGGFHFGSTLVKILLIIAFIIAAFIWGTPQELSFAPRPQDMELMLSAPFAVSFVYVIYSYTGWNASVYILDEVQDPERNIPISILFGTIFVTALYLLLNYTFLYVTPMNDLVNLADKEKVSQLAATSAFGVEGGKVVGLVIAIGLIAALSSMIVTGSRVAKVIAEDYPKLAWMGQTNEKGAPLMALSVVSGLAVLFVLTATFEWVITYASLIISIFGTFTILGLFVLKYKQPNIQFPFGGRLFLIFPTIFILINSWIIVYVISSQPIVALVSAATFGVGFLLYLVLGKQQ